MASAPHVSSIALLRLVAGPDAPRQARRAVRSRLADVAPDAAQESLVLLASELVSHCLRSGARPGEVLRLRIHRSPGVVRMEVSDRASEMSVPSVAPPRAQADLGLRTIAALSTRWGVSGDARVCAWAEVGIPRE